MKYIIICLIIFFSLSAFAQMDLKPQGFKLIELDEPYSMLITPEGDTLYGFVALGNESSLYIQGKKDASRYYKDYSPYTGAFVSSMVMPPAGLVTSIIISATPPKEYNLGIPDEKKDLLKEPNYFDGYYDEAKRLKKIRTWSGFGTGVAFFTAGMLMFGYLSWK